MQTERTADSTFIRIEHLKQYFPIKRGLFASNLYLRRLMMFRWIFPAIARLAWLANPDPGKPLWRVPCCA
jgi:hypothetical protein